MRDEYKSVCPKCWRQNYGPGGRPCGYSPCSGILRDIDRSGLAPAFHGYYRSGDRIRVRFASGEEVTGTVSRTTGWLPSYMLLRTSRSHGSSWLLGKNDRPIAVKRGTRYVATYYASGVGLPPVGAPR